MAGRPRKHALIAELNQRIADTFELEDGQSPPSHLDYVCERVECGVTTKALAAELSTSLGFDLSYAQLMAHLREQHGETAVETRIDSARVRASHLYAEEGLEIVDKAPADSSAGVSKAAVQAKQRNWLAERYNRKQYGSEKGASVVVSIGSLHLAALQSITSIVTTAPQPLSIGSGEPSAQPIQVVAP